MFPASTEPDALLGLGASRISPTISYEAPLGLCYLGRTAMLASWLYHSGCGARRVSAGMCGAGLVGACYLMFSFPVVGSRIRQHCGFARSTCPVPGHRWRHSPAYLRERCFTCGVRAASIEGVSRQGVLTIFP